MNLIAALRRYSELIAYKTYAELKAEASSYYLGVLWWVLEPALYLFAFYSVFRWGIRQGDKEFIAFLLVALVHWKWSASSIVTASNSILEARSMILQVYLPKIAFPAFAIATSTAKFALTFSIMVIVLGGMGHLSIVTFGWLIPLYGLQLLLLLGVGGLSAILIPFIKDLKPIIDSGIILLMLVSGIFFDIEAFPPQAQDYLYLNPFAVMITQYRHVILDGMPPEAGRIAYVAALTTLLIVATAVTHRLLNREVPKVLI